MNQGDNLDVASQLNRAYEEKRILRRREEDRVNNAIASLEQRLEAIELELATERAKRKFINGLLAPLGSIVLILLGALASTLIPNWLGKH